MGFLTKTFHVPKFLFQIPFFHNHGFSFTPLNIPITCFITFKIERSHQTHGTFDPFPVRVCSRVFFKRLLDKIGRKSEITVCCGRITLKKTTTCSYWLKRNIMECITFSPHESSELIRPSYFDKYMDKHGHDLDMHKMNQIAVNA